MEENLPQIKRISFSQTLFVVTNKPSEEYGEWVAKTAKLLNRPYHQVHKIFEKEKWDIDRIRRHYILATEHNGDMPSDVYWWWKRKVLNS
jgi:hypothetical protein